MTLAATFAALGSADRIAILALLRDLGEPASISRVALEVELSRFAASRHLGILRNVGLVVAVRSQGQLLHSLNHEAFESVEDWVIDYLA